MASRFVPPAPTGIQLNKLGQILGGVPAGGCPPGFTLFAKSCYESTALQRRWVEYELNRQAGFIPTLLEVGPTFAAIIATLYTAGAASPALATTLGAAKAAGTAALKIATTIATAKAAAPSRQPVQTNFAGGGNVGLDLGGILGSVGGLFGQVSSVPAIQGFGNVISAVAPAFTQTGSQNVPMVLQQQMPVARIAAPPVRLGGSSLMSMTNEIITAGGKLLGTLGVPVSSSGAFSGVLKRTLSGVASLARRTPAGTIVSLLVGLGLTAYEANLLTVWHSQRKRGRRMNPANSKALRRAARRIKSFHKLCIHTDLIRTGRSRGSARSRCGTCKKSPCRC